VLSLGAERSIDYASEDFTTIVPECDVVFDMVGGDVQRRSVDVLCPGGRLVIIAPSTKDAEGVRDDIKILRPLVNRDRRHLERIVEIVTSGGVRPPQILRMPLREARAAHEMAEARSYVGKIVFEPG
jgi:NADPH:quinone reductase-like Zn-dependent oxidoreductase